MKCDAEDGQHVDRRVHWPSAREELLEKLWGQKGLSASQIADRLGVTRNAVIGKVHRMGMSASPKKTPAIARSRVRWPAAKRRPLPHTVAPALTPIAQGEFLGRLIEDIGVDQCRYPHGDNPPFLFCAQPTKPGSAFCSFHHRRCYIPVHR